MNKNLINSRSQYKEEEIDLLRIIFLIVGIASPLITYKWKYFDLKISNSMFTGWALAALFFTIVILSYTNIFFKRHFIAISFLMFTITSMLILYFTAINRFNYDYTFLFFLVIFSTTLFIRKFIHLFSFHIFIFALLLTSLFYYGNDYRTVSIIINIYIALVSITYTNLFFVSKKQDKINILVSLIENINQNYSFNEVLMFIYNKFSTFIPYEHIGIALIKEDGRVIEASYGISEGKLEGLTQNLFGMRFNTNEISLKEIIETGKTRIINNYSEYLKDRPNKDYTKIIIEAGIKSSIILPLMVNNKPVGIIFFSSVNKNIYTQEHIKFLETIVYSISISFEKCILLEDLIFSNIMSLVKLAELRDRNTGDHLERIKIYSKVITRFLYEDSLYKNYISNEYINDIEKFAPIHDIGKVGIQDGILLKPGKLTSIEFEEMKRHTIYGGEVLRLAEKNNLSSGKKLFQIGIEIIEGHHEKWDGTGYPFNKKETDIPLSARIVAVADFFDALTSERPYKKAYPFEEAFNIILDGKGKHFDPEIVRVFEKNKNIIYEVYNSYSIN